VKPAADNKEIALLFEDEELKNIVKQMELKTVNQNPSIIKSKFEYSSQNLARVIDGLSVYENEIETNKNSSLLLFILSALKLL
jgi:hypothetical protein